MNVNRAAAMVDLDRQRVEVPRAHRAGPGSRLAALISRPQDVDIVTQLIKHPFYPIFPRNENAQHVLGWIPSTLGQIHQQLVADEPPLSKTPFLSSGHTSSELLSNVKGIVPNR